MPHFVDMSYLPSLAGYPTASFLPVRRDLDGVFLQLHIITAYGHTKPGKLHNAVRQFRASRVCVFFFWKSGEMNLTVDTEGPVGDWTMVTPPESNRSFPLTCYFWYTTRSLSSSLRPHKSNKFRLADSIRAAHKP